ncbi:MAG: hypothetical protein J6B75_04780 [Ruminococcus sp.]|nr:hypothetical protein [Ruminococcus sp.]
MEKVKKSKRRIALKVIAVILGLWVLMAAIDMIRFFSSDKQISPMICTGSNGCHCFEWREEISLGGYTFDYSYYSEESYREGKPDKAVCYFFGLKFERE